jgi:hypothetical protein
MSLKNAGAAPMLSTMTGIFVASALAIALALLALVMHRRGRRAHATDPEAP